MNDLKQLIQQFMPFAQEQMGFDRPPRLFLRQDDENAANPLGRTGFYDPQAESITIYVSGRHPKDILRSLSHELMHHTQKCNGDFDNVESQGMGEQGYAQNSPHMRTMEIQAYQASIVFRDWEDSLKETIYYEHLQKGDKTMSTKEWKDGEMSTLLTEKWGFKFNLDKLNEGSTQAGPPAMERDIEGDPSGWDAPKEKGKKKKGKVDEAHEEDWGMASHEKSRTRPGEEDYTGHRGDESAAHPGEEDYEGDSDEVEDHAMRAMKAVHDLASAAGVELDADVAGPSDWGPEGAVDDDVVEFGEEEEELEERRGRGRKDPRNQRGPDNPNQRPLEEDSGEDEAWHDWKNEHADDDHIREIEHHLRALKGDRDYERHGAEYDHDKDEDEGYDRRDEGKRKSKLSEKQLQEITAKIISRLTTSPQKK